MSEETNLELAEAYRAIFGQPPDRQFQLDVAREIAASGRMVLRAPTGSGKTRAALLAPLAAWRVGRPLVDRVIYAVPLRSLAHSLADEARRAIARLGVPLRVTVQMGGCEEDPLYERGHIIFTTIDQLLSRYLSLPYSLGAGRANMCPGAFLGTLIVVDEIHLLDRARAFPTTLVMLGRHFRNLARFLVMSATLSDTAVARLALALQCSSQCVTADESAQWPGFVDIERTVETDPRPISADAILARHNELPSRLLVVANTVARSQQLFADLQSRLVGQADVHLLHSRYLPHDRAERETVLGRLFGKKAGTSGRPRILVATQVIEVGIDISCDVMHTELAPASSLVQRLGRCARWPGERGRAVVHVPPVDQHGEWLLGPYRDCPDSVAATWRYLLKNVEHAPMRLTPGAADAFVDS